MAVEFTSFGKIARLSRECVITEKIDGTNASILIDDDGQLTHTGSRNRWITPDNDNAGFARWTQEHKEELEKLGPGRHFGEWWGSGIQRRYGLTEKRFSLFNRKRWNTDRISENIWVVPLLYEGEFDSSIVNQVLQELKESGSKAAPGFMDPEGVIVYHCHANVLFKKTFDDKHKES